VAVSWVSDDELADRVARFLHLEDHADLYARDPLWRGIVHDANVSAVNFLANRTKLAGFTDGQLANWDQGLDFHRRLGTFYALRDGAVLVTGELPNLSAMNPEKQIVSDLGNGLLVNGVFLTAAGTVMAASGASAGRLGAATGTLRGAAREFSDRDCL
jgi:hypothetical protein